MVEVTGAAFRVANEHFDVELKQRVEILRRLPGVGISVASSFLSLVEPDRYGVIDYRAWRCAFPEQRQPAEFGVRHYQRYMEFINARAAELGWQPQEVDLAIWAYDKAQE